MVEWHCQRKSKMMMLKGEGGSGSGWLWVLGGRKLFAANVKFMKKIKVEKWLPDGCVGWGARW